LLARDASAIPIVHARGEDCRNVSRRDEEAPTMRHSKLALSLCLALALGAPGCDDDDDVMGAFTGTLSGENEVPPVTTPATGTFTLDFDGSTVQYRLEVQSITSVTAAHIHSGGAGVNGPVRVTLFDGPTTGDVNGVLAEGTFDSTDVSGIDFDTLVSEMQSGNAYVNAHTTEYPGGLIRVQIQLQMQ